RMAREDGGRQKIMQLTRYATLGLCIFQGYLLALSFQHPESYHTMLPGITDTIRTLGIPLVDDLGWTFRIVTVISLTTGTLFLMWLGDQITERGVGNGISLIITIGIVARLPAALAQAWKTFVPSAQTGTSQVNPAILVLMVAFLFIVIAAVIAITQGVRKVTVQYAKRVVGRKMYGGQTQYMPLKVNYAGVMPIIFAWALLLTFNGMYCVWPPYILRPTTRFAYCTVTLRTPWVIAITAAMTINKNATISTRMAGLTWLVPVCADGTKVFHACASAAGNRATMPIVMISEMPLPIPRSVI